MKRSVSSILVLAGCAFGLAGCDPTSDTSSRDVLSEDSTLNLAVMSASGDSVPTVSDTSIEQPTPASVLAETTPAIAGPTPEPAAVITPAPRATRKSRTVSEVKPTTASRVSRVSRARSQRNVAAHRTTARASQRGVATASRAAAAKSTGPRTAASVAPAAKAPSTSMRSTTRVPAGWELTFATENSVCANATAVGDKFDVHLVDDVVGPIGVVIPKGAVATGVVSNVKRHGNRSDIDVDIESLEYDGRTYPVASDVTYTTTKKVRTRRANTGKVAAGAGTGAVAGAVIGRSTKATIIGAAAGALGGAVLANQARTYDECVPEGGRITTRLTEPLVLTSAE